MSTLQDIPVAVDPGDFTGNIAPLLHELRHALRRLADTGETTTIDLRSLPMAPGEQDLLEQQLGRGEVSVKLDALGPSEIIETAVPGIWRVTHYNQNDAIMGVFLEVARIPELLQTPAADLEAGIDGLQDLINREHES